MIDDESLKNIEKLHKLNADGVLTEVEYQKAKERILGEEHVAAPAQKAAKGELIKPAADDWFGWATMPLKRYADFEGRSGRKEYWMFHLVLLAISAVCVVLTGIGLAMVASAVIVFAAFGLLIPYLAVQVRRFHDQDKSGWFALFNLIPYVGWLIVYVFMFLEGTAGENQYGPDPMTD